MFIAERILLSRPALPAGRYTFYKSREESVLTSEMWMSGRSYKDFNLNSFKITFKFGEISQQQQSVVYRYRATDQNSLKLVNKSTYIVNTYYYDVLRTIYNVGGYRIRSCPSYTSFFCF